MSINDSMTTTIIKAVFAEEIAACGGEVRDTFDDGRNLFVRSLLPEVKEVRPNDRVQGGVALRSNGRDVWVHPYVFREVCTNGAIMAQTIQTHHFADIELRPPADGLPRLRETIQRCAAPEVFQIGVRQMRSADGTTADIGLALLSLFSRFPSSVTSQILRSFVDGRDHSVFGMANAITATARDTADQELRWDLEELGGGVFANPNPRPPQRDGHATRDFLPAPELVAY